jgi:hypothetical protein
LSLNNGLRGKLQRLPLPEHPVSSAYAHVLHQPDGDQVRDHAASSVAHERQRDARAGHHADGHADVLLFIRKQVAEHKDYYSIFSLE